MLEATSKLLPLRLVLIVKLAPRRHIGSDTPCVEDRRPPCLFVLHAYPWLACESKVVRLLQQSLPLKLICADHDVSIFQVIKGGSLFVIQAALNEHIDGILDFRHFDNVSVETPLVRGFIDVFWFDFRDAGVRDTYLDHPAHKAVGARVVAELEGGLDGVFVADLAL